MIETLSTNAAKTKFGEVLLKAKRAPVQNNRHGKPVAGMISAEDYEVIKDLKLQALKMRSVRARDAITSGKTEDGEQFFAELQNHHYD